MVHPRMRLRWMAAGPMFHSGMIVLRRLGLLVVHLRVVHGGMVRGRLDGRLWLLVSG